MNLSRDFLVFDQVDQEVVVGQAVLVVDLVASEALAVSEVSEVLAELEVLVESAVLALGHTYCEPDTIQVSVYKTCYHNRQ